MQLFNNPKVSDFCRNNDFDFLGFGSQSRNQAAEQSDFDRPVRFSKRKSLPDLVRIERELSELFGKKKIDLLTEGSISPYLADRIRKDMKEMRDNRILDEMEIIK